MVRNTSYVSYSVGHPKYTCLIILCQNLEEYTHLKLSLLHMQYPFIERCSIVGPLPAVLQVGLVQKLKGARGWSVFTRDRCPIQKSNQLSVEEYGLCLVSGYGFHQNTCIDPSASNGRHCRHHLLTFLSSKPNWDMSAYLARTFLSYSTFLLEEIMWAGSTLASLSLRKPAPCTSAL